MPSQLPFQHQLVRPPLSAVLPIIRAALAEDLGSGDITSETTVPAAAVARGVFLAKAHGVVAGLWLPAAVFAELDPGIVFEQLVPEGATAQPGLELGRVFGPARAVLAGERLALNFVQRMSGIATMASQAVDAVAGTNTKIIDTRKTTPGLRVLEKYAVRAGGASNHRFGLYDMVLIKDNHIRLAGGIAAAVAQARRGIGPMIQIEVEAANLDEVRQALEAGADLIMLDNMDLPTMAEAVQLIAGRAKVEASGNVTAETCGSVAKTGVDFISMGSLTHSYKSLDISLELELSLPCAPAGATSP
jgi:nicotinate-nucleotide pyrophosphorylase (carboxylating)